MYLLKAIGTVVLMLGLIPLLVLASWMIYLSMFVGFILVCILIAREIYKEID